MSALRPPSLRPEARVVVAAAVLSASPTVGSQLPAWFIVIVDTNCFIDDFRDSNSSSSSGSSDSSSGRRPLETLTALQCLGLHGQARVFAVMPYVVFQELEAIKSRTGNSSESCAATDALRWVYRVYATGQHDAVDGGGEGVGDSGGGGRGYMAAAAAADTTITAVLPFSNRSSHTIMGFRGSPTTPITRSSAHHSSSSSREALPPPPTQSLLAERIVAASPTPAAAAAVVGDGPQLRAALNGQYAHPRFLAPPRPLEIGYSFVIQAANQRLSPHRPYVIRNHDDDVLDCGWCFQDYYKRVYDCEPERVGRPPIFVFLTADRSFQLKILLQDANFLVYSNGAAFVRDIIEATGTTTAPVANLPPYH